MSAPIDAGVRAGDVRLIGGVPALVMRPWMGHEPGDELDIPAGERSWICCPVKCFPESGRDEEVTGACTVAEGSWRETGWENFGDFMTAKLDKAPLSGEDAGNPIGFFGIAMPLLGGTVEERFMGKLLYRCFPEHLSKALAGWQGQWHGWQTESGSIWDFENSVYSDEDWYLSHRMMAETLMALLEGDEESNNGGR